MRPLPEDLLPWALDALGVDCADPESRVQVVAGDASNRRYFRVSLVVPPVILVEAPPATEKNQAFLEVRQLLEGAGVRVPGLLAADLTRGYLLLEDLGDQMLLPLLQPASVGDYYREAADILLRLASPPAGVARLPAYDESLLGEELQRFPQWFVQKLLGAGMDSDARANWRSVCELLLNNALAQPVVLVHRDFHSRNLMPQPDGQLAVIDFQDAVRGPVTYDLVSLLRDCYIAWPQAQVRSWALAHRDALEAQGLLAGVPDEQFLRWFDLMGLQRHIKVLGTFARLALRDHKPGYLDDLPLVLRYVEQALTRYADGEPALAQFRDWFDSELAPRLQQQGWSVGA